MGYRIRSVLVGAACSLVLACSDAGTEPEGGLELVAPVPTRANPAWPLADPVTVRLTDQDGEPRAGVPVTWLVTDGEGTVAPSAAVTGADGTVSAMWTLGAEAGHNELVAGIAEGETVTVEVDAEPFRAEQVATSSRFACGLVDGAIWCWGDDSWTGTQHVSVPPDPFGWTDALDAPGRVEGPSDFVEIAASGSTVCGLDGEGTVHCASPTSTALTVLAGPPPLRSLVGAASSGLGDFCGLSAVGSTVWCWGPQSAPAALAESPDFTAIYLDRDVSAWLACGLDAEGAAWCWGTGPTGNGTFDPSESPVPVAGEHEFVELAVTGTAACGRKAVGEVWCWGRNDSGQLGVEGADAPAPVLSAAGVDRIAASHRIVLALRGTTVSSWGGANIGMPTGPVASLAGLDVGAFARNSIACLTLVGGGVYCYEWLWDRSSAGVFESNVYHPVHPVIEP
jgi:hypothetical protein